MSSYIVVAAGFMIYYSWNNKLAFKLKSCFTFDKGNKQFVSYFFETIFLLNIIFIIVL